MDRDGAEGEQAVNIMTLHSAKGLEFDTVFLPGWEEGLFPHQRSLDESGRAGLEEERRLAHVGLTRARKRAKIYFATNRRIHGMWTHDDALALPRRTAGGGCRGEGGRGRRRRLRHVGLRRFALRRDEFLRLELHHARLAARAAAQGRGGFSENGKPRYVPDGVFDDPDADAEWPTHLSRIPRHLPP